MARVTQATSQNVRIRASRKEIQAFRESGKSAKLIQDNTIILTQGQFIAAFGSIGRAGQEFDMFSGQFVQEPVISKPVARPRPSDIPKEYWGTSSERYGQVSPSGRIEKTPAQIAEQAGQEPLKPPERKIEAAEGKPTPAKAIVEVAERVQAKTERARKLEIARGIYQRATPSEKLGLRSTTLLSDRFWEFIASPITSTLFGKKTPKEITVEHIAELRELKPITVTQTYLAPGGRSPFGVTYKEREVIMSPEQQAMQAAAFENPVTELGMFYLGGAALGGLTRAPRVVSFLTKGTKTEVAARSLAVQDISRVAGGVYVGAEGIEAGTQFQRGEYAKALGTVLRTSATLGALVKGFGEGEKASELIRIRRSATELAAEGKITRQTELEVKQATVDIFERKIPARSIYETPLEDVTATIAQKGGIREATKAEKVKLLEATSEADTLLSGSWPQESQIKLSLRRSVKDLDMGVKTEALTGGGKFRRRPLTKELDIHHKLLGREEIMPWREHRAIHEAAGDLAPSQKSIIQMAGADIKTDIHDISYLKGFIFYKKPIRVGRGQQIETLEVQLARKITGVTTPARRIRKEGLEEYDVSRILQSQAEAAKVVGKRLTPFQRILIERPLPKRPIERIIEPSDYSYLPQRLKIIPSYLPSKLPSLMPSGLPSLTPSGFPSGRPSGISPPSRPSVLPPYTPPIIRGGYMPPPPPPPSKIGDSYTPSSKKYRLPYTPPPPTPPPSIIRGGYTPPPSIGDDYIPRDYYTPPPVLASGIKVMKKKKLRGVFLDPGYAPSLIGALSPRRIKKVPTRTQTGVGVRFRVKMKRAKI